MDKEVELLENLIGKDESKAQAAADYLVDSVDLVLFKNLAAKTEYLFDFVKDNVCSRIEKAVNKDNYKNILSFFQIYSPYYDDLFANILSKFANEDLTDEIFDLLENGSIEQKTYAAKYFSFIPDTVALEILNKYAFSDNEFLSYNAAQSLGQMQDDISYNIALALLKSKDEFEKLKAVRFYSAYEKNVPIDELFEAMKTSCIAENIAGLIPYMKSLKELLLDEKTKENALITIDYILSGFGEILPLGEVFQFELYDITEILINYNKEENKYSGKIAEILLKTYSKFNLFTENQEYIFDESKDTKYEISSIFKLLKSQDEVFWKNQKKYILEELKQDTKRVTSALVVISEYKIKDAVDIIKNKIAETADETLLCELIATLKNLDSLTNDIIEQVLPKIENANIKAIINSFKRA